MIVRAWIPPSRQPTSVWIKARPLSGRHWSRTGAGAGADAEVAPVDDPAGVPSGAAMAAPTVAASAGVAGSGAPTGAAAASASAGFGSFFAIDGGRDQRMN